MPTLLEQARVARRCMPQEGPVLVNHSAKEDDYVLASTFFEVAQCPQAFIDLVINSDDGSWAYERETKRSLYEAPISLVDRYLDIACSKIYQGANGSLDAIYDHGYNRHDEIHIRYVKNVTVDLLRAGDYPEDVVRRGLIAAWDHDSGNVLSRKIHSLISPRILERVIPTLNEDPQQWRVVRRAIQLHNEPVARTVLSGIRESSETSEEYYQKMRETFGAEALALIIADKSHVGRDRVSYKARSKDAVDEDPHLEVNLLGKTREIGLSEDKKTMVWKLDFTPGIDQDLEDDHLALLGRIRESDLEEEGSEGSHEMRAFVSDETHEKHRQKLPIPHFDTWKARFWNLYLDRVLLAVDSSFALYPECESFAIVMRDNDAGSDCGDFCEETTFTFQRGKVEFARTWLERKFIAEEERV